MKKSIKKVCCMLAVLVILFSCMPLSVFAVDPVSASVMANAFAQAIAAYGASNGVSMTFDVADTEGIGEGVHELWSRFRAGQQTADDYDTIAAAIWPDLYQKVLVGESAVVGLSVEAEYVQEMDDFWNWVLSGPAEMTRVDNESYQFESAQIGVNATPIVVGVYSPFPNQPAPYIANYAADFATLEASLIAFSLYITDTVYTVYGNFVSDNSDIYEFAVYSNSTLNIYGVSQSVGANYRNIRKTYPYSGSPNLYGPYSLTDYDSTTGLYYGIVDSTSVGSGQSVQIYVPSFTSLAAGLSYLQEYLDTGAGTSSIGVKAYGNTGVVDIPDNTDVNYQPLPYVGGLDIPWDDTLFGDGTGTLTDAQSEAATDAIDDAIVRDRELVLAGDTTSDTPGDETDDPPSTDPDDYQLPGLADLFPFCIPFDIYHFLQALAAAPTAPSFTCTLQLPAAIGGARTIELDFDTPTFNQIAQLLRLLELLAFIVGLALLTRSMFIRG